MKVGIMSMQRVINFGSYMQALALKTMIEDLGHEVVFVDYKARPSIRHRRSAFYWLNRSKKAIKNTRFVWACSNIYRKRPIGYRPPTEVRADAKAFAPALEELGVEPDKFNYRTEVDVLVIGSDEVFNCLQDSDNVGFSPELFGENNRAGKLISYAASFGNTTLARLNEYGVSKKIGRYLNHFDALSVRDENSAEIVRSLTGREPFQHLDPALIGGVEKMEWQSISAKGYIGIYAYSNRITAEEGKAISSYAKNNGLKVLCLNGPQKKAGFDAVKNCSPKEMLPYVKNADKIVTDTFHGTIFAIINHIPFAVICRKQTDTSYSNSEKLLDMLKKLNLMDRLLSSENNLEKVFSNEIDFASVDRIRSREKDAAIDYLRTQLG